MNIAAQIFLEEVLDIMCITEENLGSNFSTCLLEFCIFKISIKFCIPILLHKNGILYISDMKIIVAFLLY